VSAEQGVISADHALELTRRFCSTLTRVADSRRMPGPIGVRLDDVGELRLYFDEGVVSVSAQAVDRGPRLRLTAQDWFALIDDETTATELRFAGRLSFDAYETWRADYARLLGLVRLAQGRPRL
jgi:hypothetical protein